MAEDPNAQQMKEGLKVLDSSYQELESTIGATTQEAKEWIEKTKGDLKGLKEARDSTNQSIVNISISQSEVGGWAALAHNISERLAKDPETASFKSMFFILKKTSSYPEGQSFEKIAPTVQNSVNKWLNSLSKIGSSDLMSFLFSSEGPEVIYQAWPQYFKGFEYKEGSEQQSDFYFSPQTWAGVSEALYQEAAWRGLYVDQLYASLLYFETQISQLDSQLNTGTEKRQELIEQYKKKQEELKKQKEELEAAIEKYHKKIDEWKNTIAQRGAVLDLSEAQIEQEASNYALMSVTLGDDKANAAFQDAIAKKNAATPSPLYPPSSFRPPQVNRLDLDTNYHPFAGRTPTTQEQFQSPQMRDFMQRAKGLRGLRDSYIRHPTGAAIDFAKSIWGNIRGASSTSQPATTPAIDRAMATESRFGLGRFNDFRQQIGGRISERLFGASRTVAAAQKGAGAATAIAGGAAKTAAAAGAEKVGIAAVAGGPVGIAFAVGSMLLNKDTREKLKDLGSKLAQYTAAGLYYLWHQAAVLIENIAGFLGGQGILGGASAGAFGAAGFVPGFTAPSALATATSTGAAGGLVGGAGFGSVGGGGASGFGLAVSSSPLMAVGSVAATAVVVTAIIIPAAFAQPTGPAVGQQGKADLIVQKTASPSYLPDYNGSLTAINYSLKINLASNDLQISKIMDRKTLQTETGDVDLGETEIKNDSLTVEPDGSLTHQYSFEISGDKFRNSTLTNTITVDVVNTKKNNEKTSQKASFVVWINKKPVNIPYGFPAIGNVSSLDEHFGSVSTDQAVHWSCFYTIQPVDCQTGSNNQTQISGNSAIIGGIDIAGPAGTLVKSTLNGKVVLIEENSAIGGAVYVQDCEDDDCTKLGNYVVEFEHIIPDTSISVNKLIKRGEPIGVTIEKEKASVISGPHVHYQVTLINGSNVNFADSNNAGKCSEGKIEPSPAPTLGQQINSVAPPCN